MSDQSLCDANVLQDAVSEVFSTMVFMDVDDQVPEEGTDAGSQVMGSISFSGRYEGALIIQCSSPCAKTITMNLLAMEDEDEVEDSDLPDAIGEITNMVMGSVKAKAYETLGEITVSVPTVVSGEHIVNQLRAGDAKSTAEIGLDGQYRVEVTLIYTNSKSSNE